MQSPGTLATVLPDMPDDGVLHPNEAGAKNRRIN